MDSFKLHEQLIFKVDICYKPYVYNDPSFLKSNNDFEHRHFYWVNEPLNQVHAHIAFSIEGNIAFSPHKLPFGGLEVSDQLTTEDISFFLEAIALKLSESGIGELRIHQAPTSYASQTSCNEAFEQLGFQMIQNRIFHTITVDESNLFDKMHKMEQRKIKMCLKIGAEFKELKKGQKIEGFKWIDKYRRLAHKPPSMTWVDLEKANQRDPEIFKVFGVYMDDHLLAATVLVLVNNELVYHFMPASDVDFQHYKKYSPMVFLVNELYKWCQSNKINVLDLGTSYVDTKLKTTLVKFKENIGGKACSALSWQKTLSS